MRPTLALLLTGRRLASLPASADFEEGTAGSGLETVDSGPLTNWAAYGPGVAWGDYDQDGDLDVFLTARFEFFDSIIPIKDCAQLTELASVNPSPKNAIRRIVSSFLTTEFFDLTR